MFSSKLDMFPEGPYYSRVSILVLLDVFLEVCACKSNILVAIVSILVLLDVFLEVPAKHSQKWGIKVSILVLLDVFLEEE